MLTSLPEQLLSDLAFVITRPNMLADQPGWPQLIHPDPAFGEVLLDKLKADNSALISFMEGRESRFLGSYYESLWLFYLQQNPDFDVLAHGLQVHDNKKTLGEFDFIVRHIPSQQSLHQEVAVKFYLASHEQDDRGNPILLWRGPQSKDRLDLKLAHLIDWQCRLTKHPAASAIPDQLGIAPPTPQILLQGVLFKPYGIATELPEYANRHQATGYWIKASTLAAFPLDKYDWKICPKARWLTGFDALSTTPEPLTGVRDLIVKERRPWMLHGRSTDEPAQHLRLFVTPDTWPAH